MRAVTESDRRRSWVTVFVFGLWAASVAWLTLKPNALNNGLALDDFLCLWCSSRPGADKVLNWVLFIPGGLALCELLGLRRAIFVGAVLTLSIEMAQGAIPGRHPSLSDMVLNSAGAATGAWIHRIGPSPGLLRIGGVVAVVLWLLPAVLLAPRPGDAPLVALWAPSFSGEPTYQGEVLQAQIDGMPVRWTIDDSGAVRLAIARRAPVTLDLRAGPPDRGTAAVFGVWDINMQPHVVLSARHDDLHVTWWSLARTLGLEHPALRARGAFAGVSQGDPVRVETVHEAGTWCVRIDGRSLCDISPRLSDGWALFMDRDGLHGGARRAVSWTWALLLGVVLGIPLAGRWAAVVIGLLVSIGGVTAAGLSPDVLVDPPAAGFLVIGTLLGVSLNSHLGALGPGWRPRTGS